MCQRAGNIDTCVFCVLCSVFLQGVALRDVKLENTLLMCKNDDPKTGKGTSIKLCDFGYSKVVSLCVCMPL